MNDTNKPLQILSFDRDTLNMKKKVIITGATGNLGAAAIKKFISDGFHVIAIILPGEPQNHLSETEIHETDLTSEAEVQKTTDNILQKHSVIDAALLLAGGYASGNITNTDNASLEKMYALNFQTAYFIARAVFIKMKTQDHGGRIIMIGARTALQAKDGKNSLAYALSKSLLFKLAEFLNAEGNEHKVLTSIVVPSTIDTPENRHAMPGASPDKWVKPEKIANLLSYLCAEESAALRETVIKIYGDA